MEIIYPHDRDWGNPPVQSVGNQTLQGILARVGHGHAISVWPCASNARCDNDAKSLHEFAAKHGVKVHLDWIRAQIRGFCRWSATAQQVYHLTYAFEGDQLLYHQAWSPCVAAVAIDTWDGGCICTAWPDLLIASRQAVALRAEWVAGADVVIIDTDHRTLATVPAATVAAVRVWSPHALAHQAAPARPAAPVAPAADPFDPRAVASGH